ncbi:Arginine biosynthesis bifunctional protein ArgJ, chloroplastic [Sesamum angolense]|uniref:Arginine biosynthesis bifunctional protein ArgJ, chloroplastic n=1 Tax=Sesamum angolense TaxID=2727404 RepID=A0AAE2BSS9_9LAMI|nr:Arginine biosynthesis bifunctional protein ArgJ, chloroplastic [Sesamum angolense]
MNTSRVSAALSVEQDVSNYIPAAPILLPEGPWHQIPGGVAAAEGFKAAGMYGGLRAVGEKPDLALVTCDVDAISAGAFTTNVVAAAPVLYCKEVLEKSTTGDAGYQDVIECSHALAELLQLKPEQVLIESTGVIGQRIKKEPLLKSLPNLVNLLSSTVQGLFWIIMVGETRVRVGGMAKGSGMIHPNMATMLGVITTDALVTSDVWRKMVRGAVNRSFNQITVMQGLAKSIAWDGEGATCLIEVKVSGAGTEAEAAKAAVYGRDPNWGRIACAAGYAGIPFNPNKLRISLGDILLMESGQPLPFDRAAASNYLRTTGEKHGTVIIQISIGDGPGSGQAWGCDLSYDYVKINAEYTT